MDWLPPSYWQPIETAPKPKGREIVRILAAFEDGRVDIVYWRTNVKGKNGRWHSAAMHLVHGDRYMLKHQPTHWQALPEPPMPL